MLWSLHQRFGTIRWKLTASYAGVTALVMLTMEALLIIGMILYITRAVLIPERVADSTRDLGKFMRSDFEAAASNPDRLGEQLQLLLQNEEENDRLLFQITIDFPRDIPEPHAAWARTMRDAPPAWHVPVVALLDTEGQVLTATLHSYTTGTYLPDIELPVARTLIERAAEGITDSVQLSAWGEPGSQLVAIAPVFGRNGQMVGMVYTRLRRPPLSDLAADIPTVLLFSALPIVIISGLIGLIYGLFAGRDLTRRLKGLSLASAALANGDLSQRLEDSSVDEIGQLTRQFNVMSEQLAENLRALRLLADRNAQLAEQAAQLATVEERHRLARDLHDSVTQELFSLTMLAAAAQRLFRKNPDTVARQLLEIQETAQRALQETRSLIFALRPAVLDGRGLGPALRDLATAAQERQGVQVLLQISGERHLPLEHEQALFRIVQEALANVVRHSGVRQAEVNLCYEATQVCLTVCDQGRGFDTRAPRNARAIGLMSMAERATALHGCFVVQSTPGKGTQVTVTLPVPSFIPHTGETDEC